MTKKSFCKILSANDVGATGGHQGGILIPKSETELLAFLPPLDPATKNPDAWIECIDDKESIRNLRFIHYNNRMHDENGTRNEYRITYLTRYFKEVSAKEGDIFEIAKTDGDLHYTIRIVRPIEPTSKPDQLEENFSRVKITSSWRKIH